MEQLYTFATTSNLLAVTSICVALLGVAMLLHVRQGSRKAHGR